MPAKDHAAWDVLTATRRGTRYRRPTPDELADHAGARTAFLGTPHTSPPGAIRAEYERRTPAGYPEAPWPYGRGMWILTLVANAAALAITGIGLATELRWRDVLLPVLAGSWLLALLGWRRSLLPARRLAARRCPDCDADLSGVHADPPLDAASAGVDLGPWHCPACGSLWPLVPPAWLARDPEPPRAAP